MIELLIHILFLSEFDQRNITAHILNFSVKHWRQRLHKFISSVCMTEYIILLSYLKKMKETANLATFTEEILNEKLYFLYSEMVDILHFYIQICG